MRRFFLLNLLQSALLLFLFFSCQSFDLKEWEEWQRNNGKLKVLSTIGMIHDLVKQIGQEEVDGLLLIQGDLDPHSYQLVKGDDEKLQFADLIFFNGLGLEHSPSMAHYLHENEKAVALGDEVGEQFPFLILSEGNQVDPHIWMDVSIWAKVVPSIVKAFVKHDPKHAKLYRSRGCRLQKRLETLHKKIKGMLLEVPEQKRFLVTSHDAFNYFARAYLATDAERATEEWRKRFVAPEGLAPESQISSRDIRQIVEHMKLYSITVLFPESNVSRDSIRKVVDVGIKEGHSFRVADCPLYADALGPQGSGAETYEKMIGHNVERLVHFFTQE